MVKTFNSLKNLKFLYFRLLQSLIFAPNYNAMDSTDLSELSININYETYIH